MDKFVITSKASATVVRPEKYNPPIICQSCGKLRHRKETCEHCLKK